jgi:hypothetical protein
MLGLAVGFGARALIDRPTFDERVSVYGTMRHSYTTVAELAAAADVVVVARVTDQASLTYGRLPFTQSTVVALDSLKGIGPGESMTVLETGGAFHPLAKDGSSSGIGTQFVQFESVPVMSPGQNYLLFLRHYLGGITAHAFVVLGEYQGKFAINDGHIHFTGASEKLLEPSFGVQKALDGAGLADVLSEARLELHR